MWWGVAQAQDAVRTELVDQLLEASLTGVGDRHRAALTELSRRVPATEPAAPDVWYWLARAEAEQGLDDRARQTLLEGIRTGSCPRCRELFQALEVGRIGADRGTTWTFDDAQHGVFVESGGSIRLEVVVDDRRTVLEWTPEAGPESADRLVFGVREGLATLALEARSAGGQVGLHVQVVDRSGRRFTTTSPLSIPGDRWVSLQVAVAALAPVGPGTPARPEEIRRVELIERTTGRPAPIWLDSLSVR